MRVQRVLMPGTGFESWTVLGDDLVPVEPIERFLAYLASIEKSPNTIKAYAHDLKDWMTYLDRRGVDWRKARLEDVAGFVAWLRLPPQVRDGRVAVLPTVEVHCSESSVNRKLSAVTSFCGFHARHGVELSGLLITMQPTSRHGRAEVTSYRPFLHHVSKRAGERRRTIKLKAPKTLPKVLTVQQVQVILDACDHLRDRLLFALMLDTGVRVGEALGLRHEDFGIAEKAVTVAPRDNTNRARGKTGSLTRPGCCAAVPASSRSRSCWDTRRSPPRSTRTITSPSRTPVRRWRPRAGSPDGGPLVTTAEKPARGSLLEQLMAAVRPEFRVEVYVPAPNDPVFISDQCIVADCDRTAEALRQRLCCAHSQRFRKRGYRSMAEFLADPDRRPGAARRWPPAS